MQPGTSAGKVDFRKQSYYFPEPMLAEIKSEAARQGRSISWIVQAAWKVSRKRIQAMQAPPQL